MTGHFGFGQTHGTGCKLHQKTINLKSKNIKSGNLRITVNSGTECYDVLSMREKGLTGATSRTLAVYLEHRGARKIQFFFSLGQLKDTVPKALLGGPSHLSYMNPGLKLRLSLGHRPGTPLIRMVISEHFSMPFLAPGPPKNIGSKKRAPQNLPVDCHVHVHIAVNRGFSTISGPTKLILH